jgi:hypothetical protein
MHERDHDGSCATAFLNSGMISGNELQSPGYFIMKYTITDMLHIVPLCAPLRENIFLAASDILDSGNFYMVTALRFFRAHPDAVFMDYLI